jgi:outer membrane receptor for ferrienterochelin and colicin
MSTLHGSDALGGVVNIITRRGAERWATEASMDGTLQGNRQFGGTRAFEGYAGGPHAGDRVFVTLQARRFGRSPTRVEFPGQDQSADRQRTMGQLPTRGTVETAGECTFTRSEVTTSEVRGIAEGEPLFGVPAHMLNARVRWSVTPSVDATVGGSSSGAPGTDRTRSTSPTWGEAHRGRPRPSGTSTATGS